MCRLCAITQTNIEGLNVDLLDRMMLVSQTDGDHTDGSGVSNGSFICKSVLRYSNVVFGLFLPDKFPTQGRTLLGHVRRASSLTGRTRNESHPYQFIIKEKRVLHCAHNGYITGAGAYENGHEADTDSWRAFEQLRVLLEASETGDLTVAIMEEWLKEYTVGSQIGLMMLYDGVLYVFRHNKPIHLMSLGNGYVLNTSKEVLSVIGGWLHARYGHESGEVIEIPEDTLLTFHPGQETFYAEPVTVQYKKYVYTAVNTYNNHNYAGSTAIQVSSKSNETQTTQEGAAPASPGAAPPVTPIIVDPLSRSKFHRISPVAQELAKVANPMRFSLYSHWMRHSLGITSGPTYEEQLSNISPADLACFEEMNGDWTPIQASLINIWNKLVDKRHDVSMHTALFGYNWFWLDPWFISPGISRETALNRLRNVLMHPEGADPHE